MRWHEFDRVDKSVNREEWQALATKYRHEFPEDEQDRARLIGTEMLEMFISCGKPYYRVWPHMIRAFERAEFKDVPASMLRFPFYGFELRFREDGMPCWLGNEIGALIVSGVHVQEAVRDGFVVPADSLPANHRRKDITLRILFGGQYEGSPQSYMTAFSLSFNDLIEDRMLNVFCDSDPMHDMAKLMRIIVSCCFAATGGAERLIQPHILAKDIDRWRRADENGRHEIVRRAISRRGREGYEIGKTTGERLLVKPDTSSEDGEPTGRSIHGSYVRCGHWHTVCIGKGRLGRKVQWFDQTVVRPDLPPLITSRRNKQRTLTT